MNPSEAQVQLKSLAKSCRRGELMTAQFIMSNLQQVLLGMIEESTQWLACLKIIETAYKHQDYTYLADIVDYQLIPLIEEVSGNDG